ncbi:carbohydrate porin [Stappia taiwanensis]|uniref:Carbohydrate porin n=1 Tax=Stappia taiwanensis TaxID=992267 RepID=A0A838XX00_9HYPH|nr:carbohydrate porin [Stappia taiwanensis]MBA4613581.1 carbohydrate porin [Stappia taiwanensis]GGE99017.1 hypothetical protein GCM10007285_28240 [Stappia taiwanensis]
MGDVFVDASEGGGPVLVNRSLAPIASDGGMRVAIADGRIGARGDTGTQGSISSQAKCLVGAGTDVAWWKLSRSAGYLGSRASAGTVSRGMHGVTTKRAIGVLSIIGLLFGSVPALADTIGRPEARTTDLSAEPLQGPDSADAILRRDRQEKADVLDQNLLENWEEWKAGIRDRTGLSFGADYTAAGFVATESLGDDYAAGGIARFFGSFDLVNRDGPNTGRLEFKIEHRHSYTDTPPILFGAALGYAGTPQPVFNEDGFRTTTLYWRQDAFDDRAVFRIGFLDVKEYFNVYALASPWTGFQNLAFSTGSNTMSVLPDGAFGVMAGGYLTDSVYLAAGIVDRNTDPSAVFDGFDTFFNDFETFRTAEIGFTSGGQRLFVDNAHIAFWEMDASNATGAQGGRGVNVSMSSLVGANWLPFLRGAWAEGGGGVFEASVSAGFGYLDQPGGNLLGIGLNWGRPNSDTFPVDLSDQWTAEGFYRVQFAENIQITPSLQLLVDPALNPKDDFIAVFGLRARATF